MTGWQEFYRKKSATVALYNDWLQNAPAVLIIQSTPGYITSGWAPALQEITHNSSISSDQRVAWCAWTDKTQCRRVQSVLGLGRLVQRIYGLCAHRMTGVPFLAGVVTFVFSTAPRQTMGLIQHPQFSHSLWLHGAIPHTFQSMKFNES